MIWYSPLVPLLAGILLLTVSAFISRARLAILGILLILPGYALMTPLGANLLVLVIEHRTKEAATAPVCDRVQAAVLMSGGLRRPAETSHDFGALTAETLDRLFAWRSRDPKEDSANTPLTIAGGGPFRISEAEVMAALLQQLDPDAPPFQLETASENTWETAEAVRELLPQSIHRIVLASSALHLPRAMLAFEKLGFEVCPVALNRHYMEVTGWTVLLPQSSSLAKSESALHEIIGEAFYRVYSPSTVQAVSSEQRP